MNGNRLNGEVPAEVCLLRNEKLKEFVADCGGIEAKLQCSCCTVCYE